MRILVTGGAGYVGSHAVRALRDAGHEPVILDDLSTGHRRLAEATGAPLVVGSIADRELVRTVIGDHGCEGLMHFAARSLVGESVRDPALYLADNVGGTAHLLHAARNAGVTRVVVSSTAAVYGEPQQSPITENEPLAPINPYGESKVLMERLLQVLEPTGLHWCALRYFNACGASADASLGELHTPETHLIPRLLEAAATGQSAQVYGTDFATRDGTAIRDYVHVEDLAAAHVAAMERLSAESLGPINLGTGNGATVLEVLETVRRVTGIALPAEHLPRRSGDPAVLVASNVLARTWLGWTPERSDLDTIVGSAWRFHRAEAERARAA